MNDSMIAAVETLISDIKADYAKTEKPEWMIERFNSNISYNVASKYIKIITDGSVWGFIVKRDDDKQFKQGAILKAAGYKTPARNSARGNILEGGYSICWTGPYYLK
jgi:hypothetical protein